MEKLRKLSILFHSGITDFLFPWMFLYCYIWTISKLDRKKMKAKLNILFTRNFPEATLILHPIATYVFPCVPSVPKLLLFATEVSTLLKFVFIILMLSQNTILAFLKTFLKVLMTINLLNFIKMTSCYI